MKLLFSMDTSEKEHKSSSAGVEKGIRTIGWINLVFFGGVSFIANLYIFILSFNPQALAKLLAQVPEYRLSNMSNQSFLRAVFFWQTFVAIGFILSGWGIIKRKHWARKFSLYFAGLLLFLVAVGVVMQAASRHPLAWFNIILSVFWPALIIISLTSAAANSYFGHISSQKR